MRQCSLVSGSGMWRDGHYELAIVLRNSSETEAVEVSELSFQVTAYDENGEVISENRHVKDDESLAPLDQTRIPLSVPDEAARVRRCRVVLHDERGRVLCEHAVEAGEEKVTPPS